MPAHAASSASGWLSGDAGGWSGVWLMVVNEIESQQVT
jgi:hypothetical protein